MSNENSATNNAVAAPAPPAVSGRGTVAGLKKRAGSIDAVALEIDENADFGGDPYNHTGSHCVLKFGEDA